MDGTYTVFNHFTGRLIMTHATSSMVRSFMEMQAALYNYGSYRYKDEDGTRYYDVGTVVYRVEKNF